MYEANNRTLWVGNLSQDVDEELLFELFLQAGPLEKVTIPKGSNGYSKGYGFVTFKQECSVPYALALMKGITVFRKRILPQLSIYDGQIPEHKKRASLQDNWKFSFQSPRSPHLGITGSFFQGYHIPVLGASQGLSVQNDMVQLWSNLIPLMPQYTIPQGYEQGFKRRRTHHGYQYNTHCQFGMGSPWYSSPMTQNNSLNVVLCDHSVSKKENMKKSKNDCVSSDSLQNIPCRRLQKK